MNIRLSILLTIHSVLTLAAAIVLIVYPAAIPGTVGITINRNQYLICYLLGACELGLAFLSFAARSWQDVKAIRGLCLSFVVMHISTAIVEVYAFADGLSGAILVNVTLRLIVSVLFLYLGVLKSNVV